MIGASLASLRRSECGPVVQQFSYACNLERFSPLARGGGLNLGKVSIGHRRRSANVVSAIFEQRSKTNAGQEAARRTARQPERGDARSPQRTAASGATGSGTRARQEEPRVDRDTPCDRLRRDLRCHAGPLESRQELSFQTGAGQNFAFWQINILRWSICTYRNQAFQRVKAKKPIKKHAFSDDFSVRGCP